MSYVGLKLFYDFRIMIDKLPANIGWYNLIIRKENDNLWLAMYKDEKTYDILHICWWSNLNETINLFIIWLQDKWIIKKSESVV